MRHIVRKPYWNYEKEEAWLNEMAEKGWALVNYTWCRYEFEDCEKGEYIYRIELLENNAKNAESKDYISFLEDTGIEHAASYMRWIYIRRKANEGEFNLFSDVDSKLKHYKRVNSFWLTLAFTDLVVGISNINLGIMNLDVSGINKINLIGGILCIIIGVLLLLMSINIRKNIRKLKELQMVAE